MKSFYPGDKGPNGLANPAVLSSLQEMSAHLVELADQMDEGEHVCECCGLRLFDDRLEHQAAVELRAMSRRLANLRSEALAKAKFDREESVAQVRLAKEGGKRCP